MRPAAVAYEKAPISERSAIIRHNPVSCRAIVGDRGLLGRRLLLHLSQNQLRTRKVVYFADRRARSGGTTTSKRPKPRLCLVETRPARPMNLGRSEMGLSSHAMDGLVGARTLSLRHRWKRTYFVLVAFFAIPCSRGLALTGLLIASFAMK